MQNFSFVCLDFETTGLEASAEIIEIGMVKVVNGQIVERFEQLVQPHHSIPENITMLTGIDNQMVAGKPFWVDLEEAVLEFMGDHLLVAHNTSFEQGMLEAHTGRELPNLWVDTHDMAKIFLPTLTSYKLVSIASALSLGNHGFHRAINDAEVCAEMLLKMIDIACATNPFTLQKIYDVFASTPCGLTSVLEFIKTTATSQAIVGADYSTPLVSGAFTFGSEPKLSFAKVESFFKPDGLMDQVSDSFQYRPQQVGMLRAIANAFIEHKHGVIEAGTGTGKSFAYLVPSLLWAFENNCRVIVSTNTIALQEQLFKSDIPFLKQALDCDFPVALSKGRSNYLCLRRQELYKNQVEHMIWSEKIFFAAIIYWMGLTKDGDKESLNLNKIEHQFWTNMSSQAETCLGNKCPFSRRCYFMMNRKQCERSLLIITNHALLLQDIKLGGQVLPEYDHVIIDEAHNLEDETTKQFTDTLDLEFLRKNNKQVVRHNGIISRIIHKLNTDPHAGDVLGIIQATYQQLGDDVQVLDGMITEVINYVFSLKQLAGNNEKRITHKERDSNWWPDFTQLINQVGNLITTMERRLSKIINNLDLIESVEDLARELSFTQAWYTDAQRLVTDFLQGGDTNKVYWMEYTKTTWGTNVSLSAAPINIMPLLKEFLFDANQSVILTSATLAVGNDLAYAAEVYMLQENHYIAYITPSPFNYQSQSLIAIPTGEGDYSHMGEHAYNEMIIHSLEKIIPSVTGGVLVLFTSYAMLNKVYFSLKRNPALSEYNILAHGQDGSRTSIIQSLSSVEKTVVLGASSFWEGIDVKGAGLTTLVIAKLPFQPPTRPVASAKLEYIQSQGKNSFAHYSLPQAVLKFRQGCGRLIRTQSDWGVTIILDNRVLTKSYGKQFLTSLPKQPIVQGNIDQICQKITKWMGDKQ